MKLLEDWNGKLQIIENTKNVGYAQAFWNCIQLCTGDIIFTSDQDDVWLPQKIEKMIEVFKDPECVFAVCDSYITDKNLNIIGESNWEAVAASEAGFQSSSTTTEEFHNILMYCWLVYGNMMCFRKDCSDKVLQYSLSEEWSHDSWIGINAPEFGKCSFINDKLIYYRQHGKNVCGAANNYNKNENQREIFYMQHLLFHLEQHEKRLKKLLEIRGSSMCSEVRDRYLRYIREYERIAAYQQSCNMKKFMFWGYFCVTGELKMFNIKRKQVINYICFLLKR